MSNGQQRTVTVKGGALRLAAGLAAALALLGGALASARAGGTGLEARVGSVKVPRHGHVAATATCRPGSQVVSGGFATPDVAYAGGGPYTDTVGASRTDKRHFVSRASNDAFRTGRFYSYAYCGDLGRVRVASATDEIGSFKNGSATARCGRGLTAISGGYRGANPNGGRAEMVPFQSKRIGARSWRVSARNLALKGTGELVVYAYCVRIDAPPAAEVNDVRMPGFNKSSAGSSCDAGKEAFAGGFDAATPHGNSVGVSVATSRRKQGGHRWKVTVLNGDDPRHLKVIAYCA